MLIINGRGEVMLCRLAIIIVPTWVERTHVSLGAS